MALHVFDLFIKMVTDLPAQGILAALDLECRMLEDDYNSSRLPLPADAFSIFYFRKFVQAAKQGQTIRGSMPLPPDHIEFYKKTIVRLVQANELPQAAMGQFDHAFPPNLYS